MTDIELLKLAAKAAGYDWLGMWDEKRGYLWDGEGWSFDPLRDDGDAFRLAVKLGIDIGWFGVNKAEKAGVALVHEDVVDLGGDPYAATRRAIVRAAAKIGESL